MHSQGDECWADGFPPLCPVIPFPLIEAEGTGVLQLGFGFLLSSYSFKDQVQKLKSRLLLMRWILHRIQLYFQSNSQVRS